MEKFKTLAARKYRYLSCHRYQSFKGHKEYEESLLLTLTNNGGHISFSFTNLATNENLTLTDPETGEYIIPLGKGEITKLVITASKAVGAYKIVKKTIKE